MRTGLLQSCIALGITVWAAWRGIAAWRAVEAPGMRAARLWLSGGGCLCGVFLYATGKVPVTICLAGYALALACFARGLYVLFRASLHNTTM